MGAGEGLVVDGAVERAHPGGVPGIVDDLRIRAARMPPIAHDPPRVIDD
jgi:hypothetical protein